MNIAKTIAIIAASAFLSVAAAQAATDDQPKNMNGQPLVADQSDMQPMTGRSAHKKMMYHHHHHMMKHHHHKMMMMKHHHHHHHMHHHHMHKMMPKPMPAK